MSNDNFSFELDDILAEFSDRPAPAAKKPSPEELSPSPAPKDAPEKAAARPVQAAAPTAKPKEASSAEGPVQHNSRESVHRSSFAEFEALFSSEKAEKSRSSDREAPAKKSVSHARDEFAPSAKAAAPGGSERSRSGLRSSVLRNTPRPAMPVEEAAAPAPAAAPKQSQAEKLPQSESDFKPEKKEKARKLPKADKAPKPEKSPKPEKLPKKLKAEKLPEMPVYTPEPETESLPAKPGFSALHMLLSLVFGLICIISLGWVVLNVHPASASSSSSAGGGTVLKLADKLDVYMNNMASDALGELAYIRKIYTIQESDTVAPMPDPNAFGRTTDIAVIQDVIKKAAPLLEGQSVIFDPNADFVPGEEFMYYLDDTIMVIAWKEYINERCCTCAEVKIAHGSQIRRKLAEDSYSSSVQYYASDMANASNAVIAINGDFYAFRDLGITVYQRNLYRNNPASVDSCFFTADGDMIFSRAGELMGEGEAQRFIEENDVVFAVAFGPILVDNGELQYCESYPIGEINTEYSRSCIAMSDERHYFLMTINHTMDARPRATINELARFVYSKGVQKAYTLDGGQTAEIVMFGGPINHVDFGAERAVSDIIYFATAIPYEEVSQ